jgi:hypothetical protein
MVSTELPRKPFKDAVTRKREMLAKKVRKKQFGERSNKKTNISYEGSQKCHKLNEFTEDEDGS